MTSMELELLAETWIGGDMGEMVRTVVDVERTDRDEVRVGINVEGADETVHVYLAPDRAVRLAQALILEASREWKS